MKRILAVALVALLAATGFAQTTGLESVQSDVSFGVFGNELDAALTVTEAGNRPVFSDLVNQMIFGGLSNLNYASVVTAQDTFTASVSDPLWVGYFGPGDNPFSLFLGMLYLGGTGNLAGGTVETTTAKGPITVATTDTTYQWVDTSTTTEYTGNRVYNIFEKRAQVIMPFGDMNVGLGATLYMFDASPQANNYNLTEVNYYDTAIATAAPTPVADYTFTQSRTDLQKQNRVVLSVPVFLRSGDMGHTVQLGGDIQMFDRSTARGQTYTDPVDPAGGLPLTTVIETDDATYKYSNIGVNAMYEVVMAPFFGENEQNEFTAGAAVNTEFRSGEYAETLVTQNKTWAGGGAAPTIGERNFDEYSITVSGQSDFDFDLMASHSLYFDLGGNARMGIIPDVSTTIGINKEDWFIASEQNVNRVDGNADGDFADAADTITTVTTTYTSTSVNQTTWAGAVITTGAASDVLEITTEFGMSGALEVTPGNWPFSITLGSRPRLQMVNAKTTTRTSVSSDTTSTVDGTGAAVGNTTVNDAAVSDETSVWDHTFTVDAEHRIGLNMMVGEAVRLDMQLNLSTGINILDFKNMVVQAIVKLP